MSDSRLAIYAACLGSQMLFARMAGRRRLFVAVGLDAALMFLLDPTSGWRRRALLRDRTVHWAREIACLAGKTRKQLTNRARGALAKATLRFCHERVSDDVLVERHIILAGEALEAEVNRVREAVPQVRGVRTVEYRLMMLTEQAAAEMIWEGGPVPPGVRTHWHGAQS